MATPRLTDSQRQGLRLLYEAEVRASEAGNPKLAWAGSREGINGTTVEALERRGLAKAQWTDKPYARIVGRIMQPGIQLVRSWNVAEGEAERCPRRLTTDEARQQGYDDGRSGRDLAPPMVGSNVDAIRDAYQDGFELGLRNRV